MVPPSIPPAGPRPPRSRRSRVGAKIPSFFWPVPFLAVGFLFNRRRGEGHEKSILGNLRQLSAAVDQFALENNYRVFVAYDEIVGPTRYIKALTPQAEEDCRHRLPMLARRRS